VISLPGISLDVVGNEARVIRKLCVHGNHQNIVAVINHGHLPNGPHYFIDMELCDINLHEYIYRQKPFDPSESIPFFMKDAPPQLKAQQIWHVMSQISSGVKYVHSHREVHRDLKPANSTPFAKQLTV